MEFLNEIRKTLDAKNDRFIDGVSLIIGGIISASVTGDLIGDYFSEAREFIEFLGIVIGLILIGIGIYLLSQSKEKSKIGKIDGINMVLNVRLASGFLPALIISPHWILNKRITAYNERGWRTVQIIPSQSGNIALMAFRIILLILTFGFYTTANGFYVIMEREQIQKDVRPLENE